MDSLVRGPCMYGAHWGPRREWSSFGGLCGLCVAGGFREAITFDFVSVLS